MRVFSSLFVQHLPSLDGLTILAPFLIQFTFRVWMCAMCVEQFDLMTIFVCEFFCFFVFSFFWPKTIPFFHPLFSFHYICGAALYRHYSNSSRIKCSMTHTQHCKRLLLGKKEDTHFSMMVWLKLKQIGRFSLTTKKRS